MRSGRGTVRAAAPASYAHGMHIGIDALGGRPADFRMPCTRPA